MNFLFLDEIWKLETEDGSCNNNDLPGVFINSNGVINGRRQYIADVRALWSQNETLTSGGCSWWYIPVEFFETVRFLQKDYFACFGQISSIL